MNAALAGTLDWAKGNGLLPLIVQHAHDGRVLMLGYTDRDALEHTLATHEVHFWSRSKQRLWRKGETSGDVLKLVSIVSDCDNDTLLCQAIPAGPTCHLGTSSCFDREAPAHPWLNELEALIASREGEDPSSSYVANCWLTNPRDALKRLARKALKLRSPPFPAIATSCAEKPRICCSICLWCCGGRR